jgi:hypothetical protein
MARGLLSQRQARRSPPLIVPSCDGRPHPVLARLSAGYPKLRGRLPTHYSPFRHSHPNCIATTGNPVRLACLIHAASVRSEPESNSPKKYSSFSWLAPRGAFISRPTLTQAPGKSHRFRFEALCVSHSVFKEQTTARKNQTSCFLLKELGSHPASRAVPE